MIKNTFLMLTVILLLGCGDNGLNLKVRFDHVQGLTENSKVMFEGNEIGVVRHVEYSKDGDYVVDIFIRPEFVNAATQQTKFFTEKDPGNREITAVELALEEKGGTPLKNGTVVKGSERPSFFKDFFNSVGKAIDGIGEEVKEKSDSMRKGVDKNTNDLKKELEKGAEKLKRDFESFADEMRKLPEKEEFRELGKELERFSRELQKSGESIGKQFREEFLPKLQKDLEQLRKKLEKEGRQKELEPLEKTLKKIRMT